MKSLEQRLEKILREFDNCYFCKDEGGLEYKIELYLPKILKEIEKENRTLKFRKISDSKAKKEITDLILRGKKKGIKKISTWDIVRKLKLPAYQAEKIIDGFLKERKLFEIK